MPIAELIIALNGLRSLSDGAEVLIDQIVMQAKANNSYTADDKAKIEAAAAISDDDWDARMAAVRARVEAANES